MTKRTRKRCSHKTVVLIWHPETGQELARRCSPTFGCAEWLTYGPSNDEAPAAIEIRAAELSWDVEGLLLDSNEELTGWLAREIIYAGTRHDIGAWSWDITRPIVEQELGFKEHSATHSDCCDVNVLDQRSAVGVDNDEFGIEACEAEQGDDDLRSSAARQAAKDGYNGPACILELEVGDEPEHGIPLEFSAGLLDHIDCPCSTVTDVVVSRAGGDCGDTEPSADEPVSARTGSLGC